MAAQIDVKWHVLLDENLWDSANPAFPPARKGVAVRGDRHSLREKAGLLALLLALLAYGLWNSLAALAAQAESAQTFFPQLSADRLAAASRQVVLTEHLRIYAAGVDVATAQAQAAALERLYAETFAAVGVPLTHGSDAPDGRFVLSVAGNSLGAWDAAGGAVRLPSPARQSSAAGRWSDSALLRQSWAIALAEQAAREAGAVHDVPAGWQPLLGGLRLWMLWNAGGPLAESRAAIVEWLYGGGGQSQMAAADAAQICAAFALWQQSPLHYGIPLACGSADDAAIPPLAPPAALADLHLPEGVWDSVAEEKDGGPSVKVRARTVALALLIEYAVESYGRETLATFLAALGEHKSWETLIPAVYGVTAGEFEAGWWEWIAESAAPQSAASGSPSNSTTGTR